MNKSEVIKTLSQDLGITQTETEELYDEFVSIISKHLAEDTGFTLPGLGSFHSKVREAYKSYNPHYKKMMLIPKKKVVQFTPSSAIKDELNGGAL
jgi:nucleoid DNA-binding protein